MKRKVAFLLALVLTCLTFYGCGTRNPFPDLSGARSVEIRVYSQTDQTYTDYRIKERERVREICTFFAEQEYQKVKITEPMKREYQVRILYATGAAIATFTLPLGHHVIDCGGHLYRIRGDVDGNESVAAWIRDAERAP